MPQSYRPLINDRPFNGRMPSKLYNKLARLARRERLSVSAYIVRVAAEHVAAMKAANADPKIRPRTCALCGGRQVLESRPHVIRYKGHERNLDVGAAWRCLGCGEGILEGASLAAHDRALSELRSLSGRQAKPPTKRLRRTAKKGSK